MFHTPPVNLSSTATLESYRELQLQLLPVAETVVLDAADKPLGMDYARELKTVQLPEELVRLVDAFLADLQAPKYAQPLSTDQVALLFQQFYGKFDECLREYLQSTGSNSADADADAGAGADAETTGTHRDYVEHMEALLCSNKMIFSKIFQNNMHDLRAQVHICEKVYVLRHVVNVRLLQLDLDLLQLPGLDEDVFRADLEPVEKLFNKTNSVRSPLEKLIVFSSSFEQLVKLVNRYRKAGTSYISADILIPAFIYFAVHRRVHNLYLNFKFIKRFKYSRFWASEGAGALAYNMTNIEALLTYLLNMDYRKDLGLTDAALQDLLDKARAALRSSLRSVEPHKPPADAAKRTVSERKKMLIDKLEQFRDDNDKLLDNLSLRDMQQMLSPFEEGNMDETHVMLPPPPARRRKPGDPEAVTPRSLTFSDAATVSGGLVLNVADQGFRNLSSVFDSSLKFLGNKMANNSNPNLTASQTPGNSLSSILGDGRSRSNSANSSILNSRNRSNSTLNSIFNSNSNIRTITETSNSETDVKEDSVDTHASSHPLNKFMRWRTSSLNSVTTDKPDDASIGSNETSNKSINSNANSTSHSRNGSLSLINTLKKNSPKIPLLSASLTLENSEFKKVDKSFDEMSVKELHDLYNNYNLLVGILHDVAK